jgi:uncharacterized protein (DUF488 family)
MVGTRIVHLDPRPRSSRAKRISKDVSAHENGISQGRRNLCEADEMSRRKSGLVSIGYEGRTSEELLSTLVELNVTTLVDVRLTPLSRKPGLSKTRLAASSEAAGVKYVHLSALGNPKDNREPFREGRAQEGCIKFTSLLARPAAVVAMDQLEALARDGRVAVLCFERDHDRCHRQVIVTELADRLGSDISLVHA